MGARSDMCGNDMEIKAILDVFCTAQKCDRKLSEIDTQVLLVEPILYLAGYDIYDPYIVKRASRSRKSQEFDIEVYKGHILLLAIEVKALSSNEFNINSDRGVGALKEEEGKWKNYGGDGVGQLRAYCLNRRNKVLCCTTPILTNGQRWALFTSRKFLDKESAKDRIDPQKEAKVYDITNPKDFCELLEFLKDPQKYMNPK
ncbi:MAG: hypothetical protein QXS68_06070 [Candidatus Methanomethylicaceae archaeon]